MEKKNKQIEKINLFLEKDKDKYNFLQNLKDTYSGEIKNLSIKSSNTVLPIQLVLNIFDSDLNTITHFVSEDKIHLSKIIDININKSYDKSDKSISMLNEIRNNLSSELFKITKISTNDRLLNNLIDSF